MAKYLCACHPPNAHKNHIGAWWVDYSVSFLLDVGDEWVCPCGNTFVYKGSYWGQKESGVPESEEA